MHPTQTPIISAHRLARFIIWLSAVLAWFALGRPARTAAEQRHQARYACLTRTRLLHAVRNVILIRAALLLKLQRRAPAHRRPLNARPGFRRAQRGNHLRAVGGAWLRRKLKVRGGLIEQALHLLAVLRHLTAFVTRFARLRRHGLTHQVAIICASPRADLVRDLAAPPLCAADTS